jgi:hypothetical protein
MLRTLLVVLVFALSANAQTAPGPFNAQADNLKKEAPSLQAEIDGVMNSTVPGLLLEPARAFYLDGYGLVVTLKVALALPRSPFNAVTNPEDIKKVAAQRRKDIKEKLVALLKQRAGSIEALAADESISIAVFMMNTNPADLKDLPSHVIFSIKKQDALDFMSKKIADLTSRVSVREFQ